MNDLERLLGYKAINYKEMVGKIKFFISPFYRSRTNKSPKAVKMQQIFYF